jgi:hypothetical protein
MTGHGYVFATDRQGRGCGDVRGRIRRGEFIRRSIRGEDKEEKSKEDS